MQKLNLIIQFIIRFFLFFLLTLIWARFFFKSTLTSILISTLIALFIEFLLQALTLKKDKSKKLKLKEKEDAENMFLSLSVSKNGLSFFYNLALKRCNTTKKKDYILIKHDDYNVVLYPFINFTPISPDDITKILVSIKKEDYKKVVIPCGEITKESFSFSKNFEPEILLLDKYETYLKIYKDYDFFPEITHSYKKTKKESFKDLLLFSFNRSRTKSYLFSAIILLFSSLFTRLNLYYSIFASILIIFAIISFLNPFKKCFSKFEL